MADNKIKITIESYNQTASEYANKTADLRPEGLEKFLDYLKPCSYVLDLGCGAGRDARRFLDKGHRVVGIDLSSGLLGIARRDVPEAEFKLMDITNLEFAPDTFDGICALASMVHVPKSCMFSALRGCYRILSDKGIMYVSVKRGDGESMTPDARYGGVQKFWSFFQQDEIEGLLHATGFEVVDSMSIKKHDSYATNPWIDIVCRKIGM
ncbi:MAG: class I SAM-dependent methyltransferase [archaeon]